MLSEETSAMHAISRTTSFRISEKHQRRRLKAVALTICLTATDASAKPIEPNTAATLSPEQRHEIEAPRLHLSAAPPIDIDRGCPDRRERRGSELCAQWKAADAASRQADAALYSLILGAVTLLAAVAAAYYARNAARETQRGSNFAELGLRPWLVSSGVELINALQTGIPDGRHGDWLLIRQNFVNEGLTAATNVKLDARLIIVPNGVHPTYDPELDGDGVPIGPKARMHSPWGFLSFEEMSRVYLGELSAFYCMRVEYSDKFGTCGVTQLCSLLMITKDPQLWFPQEKASESMYNGYYPPLCIIS